MPSQMSGSRSTGPVCDLREGLVYRSTFQSLLGDQMFRRSRICSAALIALGGTLSLGGTPAFGQAQLERVEITGSSIRRIDAESALPVQVLKRDDIQRSGATTVVDLLQKLPSV